MTTRAMVLTPDEGETIGSEHYHLRFLAQSPEHQIALTENTVPARFPGPVLHRHRYLTDIFYVLDGVVTLRIENERHRLGRGGFGLVPPGVAHTFSNEGDVPATFLNIYQPSGNEHYLKEVGKRLQAGETPTAAEMAKIAARYDFEAVEERDQPS